MTFPGWEPMAQMGFHDVFSKSAVLNVDDLTDTNACGPGLHSPPMQDINYSRVAFH